MPGGSETRLPNAHNVGRLLARHTDKRTGGVLYSGYTNFRFRITL
jgi:hypothetical protein